MPKNVRFTQDYRGVLTREAFFEAGTVVALSDDIADRLIGAGRATAVRGRQPAEAEEPKPEPSILDGARPKKLGTVAEHTGGGWYTVFDADGAEVARVKGKEDALKLADEVR